MGASDLYRSCPAVSQIYESGVFIEEPSAFKLTFLLKREEGRRTRRKRRTSNLMKFPLATGTVWVRNAAPDRVDIVVVVVSVNGGAKRVESREESRKRGSNCKSRQSINSLDRQGRGRE
jgi:hypothetical protein